MSEQYIPDGEDQEGYAEWLDQKTEIESLRAEIARLREERRWIPVGERLPDKEMPVMVLSSGIAFIACASWGRWLAMGGLDRNLSHVTHWMPLPPGPEVKEVSDG